MELKLRVAKFEARLREIERAVFATKREAEMKAQSLRKTRRELMRLGAQVTAAEIRVRKAGGGWAVTILEETGRDWKEVMTKLEETGQDWTILDETGLLDGVLGELGD